MSEKGSASPLAIAMTALMYLFYVGIMLYIIFVIRQIKTFPNCNEALLFEAIGFVVGAFVVFTRAFSSKLNIGYYIPIIGITLLYTAALHVLCIVLVGFFYPTTFVLINALLLFMWCVVSIPMILMGRK